MVKPYRLQEPIPPLAISYDLPSLTWSITDVGASHGWEVFTPTPASGREVIATYDAELDMKGVYIQEHTAFLDAIKETEALPPACINLAATSSLTVITLLSTTPFGTVSADSIFDGYSFAGDSVPNLVDLNQLLFRQVRTYVSNPNTQYVMQKLSDDVIAGTNAFAMDKIYLRKILYANNFTAPYFATNDQLIIWNSWIQGFGLQDKEPDLERIFRMQRNSKLYD